PNGASLTLDATASADVDGSIATYEWFENGNAIATGATPQLVLGLGQHVLTLRVTDDNGASSEAQQTITILNSTPTVSITGPDNIECRSAGESVTFVANARDVDGTMTFAWSPTGATTASTTFVPAVGTTQVSVAVTDNNGASAMATTSVTVGDNLPPSISMLVSPTALLAGGHDMVKVVSRASARDACDPAPQFGITVTSSESVNASGDGSSEPDWNVVANGDGTYDVYVRAERSGNGDGRTYTITATA